MAFYHDWLDRTIAAMGYTKARDMNVGPIFAGETPPGSGLYGYQEITTEESKEKLAVTSAWVYSDIKAIANEASSAQLQVLESQGEDEPTAIANHPFELLLQSPNPHMTRSWMWQYTIWWLLLHGEAYWLKAYTGAGELAELWPIPANRMSPVADAVNYISGFRYQPANGMPPTIYAPEQVVFFRFPNPFDYHRGLSPLSAYRLAMETDVAASKWNQTTFENDVTLRTLISLPETMTTDNFKRVKGEILSELIERQRRYMITRAGMVDVKTMSISHKDLDFLAGREFTREEIDRVFGIPAGFWAKEATRANSEAAKAVMIEQAVWPLLTLLAEQLTLQCVRYDFGEGLVAEFDDIRSEDRALLIEERKQYWQVKTVDEARSDLGLDPLEDVETGAMLVPLAVSPSASSSSGNNGGGFSPILSESISGSIGNTNTGADEMMADLKRWESIARRKLKAGETAAYDFESDAIPLSIKAFILEGLKTATTESEVKARHGTRPNSGQPWSVC